MWLVRLHFTEGTEGRHGDKKMEKPELNISCKYKERVSKTHPLLETNVNKIETNKLLEKITVDEAAA